jgi:23S rRNA (guanosine2251-2'-O)-methyltransferase
MGRGKHLPALREHRIRYGDDLIWGIHPVLEMLESQPQRILELCVQIDKQSRSMQEIIDAARAVKIKCLFVDKIRIGGSPEPLNHQGIVAKTAPLPLLPFADLLAYFKAAVEEGKIPRLMACDSIQDPRNLGAIIRSAHAAGVTHLIVPRDRSAPLSGTAAKASAGAIARLKISQVTNLAEALKQVKEAGGWIFGAVKDEQAASIYSTDFNVPACLVVGNEGSGLRPLVKRHCDVLVSIPMAADIDSLNSSVAAAVILFEMVRQSLN